MLVSSCTHIYVYVALYRDAHLSLSLLIHLYIHMFVHFMCLYLTGSRTPESFLELSQSQTLQLSQNLQQRCAGARAVVPRSPLELKVATRRSLNQWRPGVLDVALSCHSSIQGGPHVRLECSQCLKKVDGARQSSRTLEKAGLS